MKDKGWLKRSAKKRLKRTRLARKTRLRARGKRGARFPQRRHPAFMRWMRQRAEAERLPCDGCGKWEWLSRAHLQPTGSGGGDLGNVVLLCEDDPGTGRRGCHPRQEKNTERFVAETGRDLYARAQEYRASFHQQQEHV